MCRKLLKSIFILAFVMGCSGCGCSSKSKDKDENVIKDPVINMNNQVIEDQEIGNGIVAKETNLVTVGYESTLTTQIQNNSDKDVYIKYVDIIFKNDKDEVVKTLIGYVGTTIKSKDSYYVVTSINMDLSQTKKIEYKVNY